MRLRTVLHAQCAVGGRLLYSGEFAYVDERQGLPTELSPLADMVTVGLEQYEDDLDEDRQASRPNVSLSYADVREQSSGHQ